MSFFTGIFSGTFSAYLQQMINTVICSKEMGTILSFRRQVIMPSRFDTFVIRPPPPPVGGLGGWEGGLSYGYDGHAERKIRKRPNRAWVRPHLTCMLLLLFVCLFFFFNEKTINDALNMGTNFGFPSQGGPRRSLPCLLFYFFF